MSHTKDRNSTWSTSPDTYSETEHSEAAQLNPIGIPLKIYFSPTLQYVLQLQKSITEWPIAHLIYGNFQEICSILIKV